MRVRWMRKAIAGIAAVCGLAGCVTTATYRIDAERGRLPALDKEAPVSRLPLAVGLHVVEDAGRQVHEERRGLTRMMVNGGDVVPYFRWAMRQMFARVVDIASYAAGDPVPSGLAGVISLQSAGHDQFDFTLHARDQSPIEWRPWGGAPVIPPFGDDVQHAVSMRIRDLLANTMLNFQSQKGVRAWIEREAPGAGNAPAFAEPGRTGGRSQVVLFARDAADARECLQGRGEKADTPPNFMDGERFRQAMYPWFEPSTEPEAAEKLRAFLSLPNVRMQLESLGVAHLAWFSERWGRTDKSGGVSCGGGYGFGCLGLEVGTVRTDASVVLVTVGDATSQELKASKAAGYAIPALGLPIPIIPATRSAACADLAAQFGARIRPSGAP